MINKRIILILVSYMLFNILKSLFTDVGAMEIDSSTGTTVGIVNTIAGNGSLGYSGDGQVAISAKINQPGDVKTDRNGNVFFVDSDKSRIRKVDKNGTITTVAGNGSIGYTGDGGAASSAAFSGISGIAIDTTGNIFIADSGNSRIRKIDTNGMINTVAGNGSFGYSGDGGAAISASLCRPSGVAVDNNGNIYIADFQNLRIRKVNENGIISTIAGNGLSGYSGDGGAATSAKLVWPIGVAVDNKGSVYIAEGTGNCIRKVDANGIISTIAGKYSGTSGYAGDGDIAKSAVLHFPTNVTVDNSGNVYIVDKGNHCIRKIDTSGIINTIAGTGLSGYSGDGSTATTAKFNTPSGITIDNDGVVYISDELNNRIRSITYIDQALIIPSPTPTPFDRMICTIAGDGMAGYSGNDGLAVSSMLNGPSNMAVDRDGNIYFTDTRNNRIRKINTYGIITTIAGNGGQNYSGDGGAATSAMLNCPSGIALDHQGNIYFSDTGNRRIRKINKRGIISTIAGNGTEGSSGDGSVAIAASISTPRGIAVDNVGNVYVAHSDRIRKINTCGIISTIAGNVYGGGYSGDGGKATSAQLFVPRSMTVDNNGNVYIADCYNHRIRKIDSAGIITTIAGNGISGFSGDGGDALEAEISYPQGVAVDQWGNLYINASNRIRKVYANGTIDTIAGNGKYEFSGDGGIATSAAFNNLSGISIDSCGNILVADTDNNKIRKIFQDFTVQTQSEVLPLISHVVNPTTILSTTNTPMPSPFAGMISTISGNGTAGYSGDGGDGRFAILKEPWDLTSDRTGNIYFSDSANNCIRKIDNNGIISTIAGNGNAGYTGDGGNATSATLRYPGGIAVDNEGNVYFSDTGNQCIRMIDSNGVLSTVAGNGAYGYSGDGGPATSAELSCPVGIAIDNNGNIYFADENNNCIRMVNKNGIITTIAGNGLQGYTGDGGAATSAKLCGPIDVAVDNGGNIYFSDNGNKCVRKVDPSGIITTVAKDSMYNFFRDGVSGFVSPIGISVDNKGYIYFADAINKRIYKINQDGMISTIAGSGLFGYSGDGWWAVAAKFSMPVGITANSEGSVYISDIYSNCIRKILPGEVKPCGINNFVVSNNIGNINISHNLTNNSMSWITVKLVYSIYNPNNNTLLGVKTVKATLNAGETLPRNVSIAIANDLTEFSVKVIVLDGFETLKPLVYCNNSYLISN